MATLKKQGVVIGKKVRAATGLPLPVAMQAGKKIARGNASAFFFSVRAESYTEIARMCADDQCSCKDEFFIKGPRGRYQVFF